MKRKRYVVSLYKVEGSVNAISIGEYVNENTEFIFMKQSRYKFPFYKESINKLSTEYNIVTYKEAVEIDKKYSLILMKYEDAYQEYREGLYEAIDSINNKQIVIDNIEKNEGTKKVIETIKSINNKNLI
ncbi:hypothetical protein M0P65_07730 [Candidatus Gracilibacteria bacterium]|jgi:hypothetical protein|nr:hypothetical protein [Candidatus Gracilibacteria bacterium]